METNNDAASAAAHGARRRNGMKYILGALTEGEMIELRKQLRSPANPRQPRAFNSLTKKVREATQRGPKLVLREVAG